MLLPQLSNLYLFLLTFTFTEASKELSENVLGLRKVNRVSKQDNLPGNDTPSRNTPSEGSVSQIYGMGACNIGTKTDISASIELEAEDESKTDIDSVKPQTVASDSDADDASSSVSSLTSEGTSEPDVPRTAPPRPPKPPKPPKPSRPTASTATCSTGSDSELKGDFKTKILGNPSGPPLRDLSKKAKPSAPEQLDFRGQLKKTGLRADKDLTAQGKKQQQDGDFRRQLKTTGADTSRNLSASRTVGRKKEGIAQVDFRGQLSKTKGLESPVVKKGPPRPPPTYLSKKPEPGGLPSQSPARTQTTEAKEDVKTADKKEGRKISSADLLNMLHKPVETSKESYLVQRGIKKAEAPTSVAQKFVAPSKDISDETFHARMAQRKERSEKIFPSKDPRAQRKISSSGDEDFRAVLKKAASQKSRVMQKRTDLETEEQRPSTGEVNR